MASVGLAPTPVFVDADGRRGRLVAWVSRALASVLVAYLVLLGGALVGAPWVPRVSLPGVGRVVPGRAGPPLAPRIVASPGATSSPSPPRATGGIPPPVLAGAPPPAPPAPTAAAGPVSSSSPSTPTTIGAGPQDVPPAPAAVSAPGRSGEHRRPGTAPVRWGPPPSPPSNGPGTR
jgi:hypothetical protein